MGQHVSRRNPGAYKEASFQGIWEVTNISWKAEGVRGQAFTIFSPAFARAGSLIQPSPGTPGDQVRGRGLLASLPRIMPWLAVKY